MLKLLVMVSAQELAADLLESKASPFHVFCYSAVILSLLWHWFSTKYEKQEIKWNSIHLNTICPHTSYLEKTVLKRFVSNLGRPEVIPSETGETGFLHLSQTGIQVASRAMIWDFSKHSSLLAAMNLNQPFPGEENISVEESGQLQWPQSRWS